jgi:L-seryl-tRNA(Ser) seleniumtransferase
LQETEHWEYPREALKDALRTACQQVREADAGAAGVLDIARRILEDKFRPPLQRVINATGVILHTNLGRAPLSGRAKAAVMAAADYCNLEYDLRTGQRGPRGGQIEGLLCTLTGAEAAVVVNNGAAAMLLTVETLARGREVVVSRGELIEIGGGFRLPEVLAQSGAKLVEVGTTNKTYVKDYEAAIGPSTGLLLKSHQSNFRMVGFTHDVSCRDLVELGARHNVPVAMDLGSGLLMEFGDEPTVPQIVKSGVGLVVFSGDKLLGGPQAGIIVGRKALVDPCRKHPLMRALRCDKLTLAALEGTLQEYLYEEGRWATDLVPVLGMLTTDPSALRQWADQVATWMKEWFIDQASVEVRAAESEAGGGSLPGRTLPTYCIVIRPLKASVAAWEQRLRMGEPVLICRVQDDALWLDVRTIPTGQEEVLARAIGKLLPA